MPQLNNSATTIQRVVQARRQRIRNEERNYQDTISREFDENMARARIEEQRREKEAINELDQILRQDARQQSAAKKLQKVVKGHQTRSAIKQEKQAARQQTINKMQNEIMAQGAVNDIVDNAVSNSAAKTLQSAYRNKKAINETLNKVKQKIQRDKAATTLQNAYRNKKAINETLNRATDKTLNRAIQNQVSPDTAIAASGKRPYPPRDTNTINQQVARTVNRNPQAEAAEQLRIRNLIQTTQSMVPPSNITNT